MSTGFYLLDNPPVRSQYANPRRNGASVSGVIVVHTAENVTDREGVDTGAENVASWITRRDTAGSYHRLCDSDSIVKMVPFEYEAWHDTRTNNHSIGISGAVRSADWNSLGDRGKAVVQNMALAAIEARDWVRTHRGFDIPARFVTQAEAMKRKPGFVAHGTMDPLRRSDPGRDFDWDLFFNVYVGGGTVPLPVPAPAPVQLNPYGRPFLREDGSLGPLTITEWQRQEGTTPDGYITGQTVTGGRFHNRGYSSLVAAAQRRHGSSVDGYISYPRSGLVMAMQRRWGLYADGYISVPESNLVRRLQKALNEGHYR